MIGLPALYTFTGLIFVAYAALSVARKRFGNAAFWGLLAASFLAGDRFGNFGNGLLVLALVALAGTGALRKPDVGDQAEDGSRRGNALFLPALIIPVTALAGTFLLPNSGLIDPKQITLISLGLGVILALIALYAWLRPPALAALEEGRRLIDAVGWAALLPQMLASLGAVFAVAGVGDLVGGIAGQVIPHGSLFAAVLAYAIGMALFTMIMGNAFAAFPVMTAAIGLPLLVHGFGGNPAIVCAIGMLAGFCGTLMTPMAANFNIVPAALLELKDRNAVVKAQVGTALPLLACNIILIYWLAFP
ncbi:DUF979 family protein [Sphingomonas sp. MAH-20]|uniref:DUF979 family protein n=1 Tax=Sphingomonas horti TaxID=2682842 RepID=A0A6I4J155_9SPHN|nr:MULTISPECIES: DUF979 domain-containing protein [Sphingomonas]MBA2919827.1 DUF979 domain-containing protein [Sphingomonas sp. CGMCC 1.13658]MVO78067.1 DUF979 family protein [Sphingomonas horti]